MLIIEGAYLSHIKLFDKYVGVIPKGYLYLEVVFSLSVELLNMSIRKKKMNKNKPYSKVVSRLLLLIFFLPTIVLFSHSFCDHKHEVFSSKETTEVNHKDFGCNLHLVKIGNSQLVDYHYQFYSQEIFTNRTDLITYFLPNYQQLSFSLRAPPLSVLQ